MVVSGLDKGASRLFRRDRVRVNRACASLVSALAGFARWRGCHNQLCRHNTDGHAGYGRQISARFVEGLTRIVPRCATPAHTSLPLLFSCTVVAET